MQRTSPVTRIDERLELGRAFTALGWAELGGPARTFETNGPGVRLKALRYGRRLEFYAEIASQHIAPCPGLDVVCHGGDVRSLVTMLKARSDLNRAKR